MKELAEELDRAMRIDDNTFLAFDVFNIRIKITEVARAEKFNTLLNFTGTLEPQNPNDKNILEIRCSIFKAELTSL